MKIRKNILYMTGTLLATVGIFYLFFCQFISLGAESRYAHLTRAAFLLGLAAVCGVLLALSMLFDRLLPGERQHKKWHRLAAALPLLAILALSAVVRIRLLSGLPEATLQKYRTCYEIALALSDGSIQGYGGSYGDLIAASPLQMGYSFVLSMAFRIFGASVRTGQYLNVFFSVASAFLSYKIARTAGGRAAGIAALLFGAFWPAGILTDAVLSPDHACLALALLCLWLFLFLLRNHSESLAQASFAVLLYIVLGVLLGIGAALSPLSCILLIAFLLLLLPLKDSLPALPLNEIPLAVRALRWGWIRCLMLLLPYLILTGVIASNIELAVNRDIAVSRISWSVFFGGTEDSLSHGRAAERADSFISDYVALFGDERAQTEQYSALLDEQGQYTQRQDRPAALAAALDEALYPALLFFALTALLFLLFGRGNAAVTLIYVYTITVLFAVFSGAEEYGAFVSRLIILLASLSVSFFFSEAARRRSARRGETQAQEERNRLEQYQLELREQAEDRLTELRKEAYANVFDMDKALREGHVVMTVSQAYEDQPPIRQTPGNTSSAPALPVPDVPEDDDFDWKYTDEELNSMADADWAYVKPRTDGR